MKLTKLIIAGAVNLALFGMQSPHAIAKAKYCPDLEKAVFGVEMGSGSADDPQVLADNERARVLWNSTKKKMPKAIHKDWQVVASWRGKWTVNSRKALAAWRKEAASATPEVRAEIEKLEAEQSTLAQDPKFLAAVGRIQRFGAQNCS
jgi:hypothetical protein